MMIRLTARGIIINEISNKILLIKLIDNDSPSSEKYSDGFWIFPGGGVEEDESFIDCLTREIYEETGMSDIEILHPVASRNILLELNEQDNRPYYERYYIVKTDRLEINPKMLSDIEHKNIVEYKWWDISDIEKTDEIILPKKLKNNLSKIIVNVSYPYDLTEEL